jgi:hypothetical protein
MTRGRRPPAAPNAERPLRSEVTIMPRIARLVSLFLVALAFPSYSTAQHATTTLEPPEIALACAPPPAYSSRQRPALHVAGAQDTVARSVFDDHDLLIIRGGNGLIVGQRYFVRRPVSKPNYENKANIRHPIHTAGWIRIVAVNDSTSIALVEHACSAIHTGDYLEPFAVPAVRAEESVSGDPSDLDFGAMGRIVYGDEERVIGSPGTFVLIDRGTGQGVESGARLAVYRDVQEFVPNEGRMRSAHLPLAAIGEAVVVSSGPSVAVVQLISARDVVRAGDFVVPRRH